MAPTAVPHLPFASTALLESLVEVLLVLPVDVPFGCRVEVLLVAPTTVFLVTHASTTVLIVAVLMFLDPFVGLHPSSGLVPVLADMLISFFHVYMPLVPESILVGISDSPNSTNSPNLANKFDVLSQLEEELND